MGRPRTGRGRTIGVRVHTGLEAEIDSWIAAQPEPRPSRPEAIRRLTGEALAPAKQDNDISSDVLQPLQCRMARVALGWTLDDLAAATGVSRRAILRYEQGESTMRTRNLVNLRGAFEQGGICFVDEGDHAGAVMPPMESMRRSSFTKEPSRG